MEKTGEQLKQEGMNTAFNANSNNWGYRAFNFLKEFLTIVGNRAFMAEEIREFAHEERGLEYPPSKRAWGSIIVKAKNSNLIKFKGYSQVNNPKAHRANAGLWCKV